jgi:hypothetical protein
MHKDISLALYFDEAIAFFSLNHFTRPCAMLTFPLSFTNTARRGFTLRANQNPHSSQQVAKPIWDGLQNTEPNSRCVDNDHTNKKALDSLPLSPSACPVNELS